MIDVKDRPILAIEGLRFTYPKRRGQDAYEALRGVSLRVAPGESVALLGPNGSGKSTLMRLICGMMPPSQGTLMVDGLTDPQQYRTHLSVVFQTNGLDPHLTVKENLECQASLYGLSGELAQRRINEELERGVLLDRRDAIVKTLSGGLKRRVDLARAMLHHPRLLLLDEPTVGLDPAARQMFLDAIEERQREARMTLLMSTHLIDEADRCDRAVFVHQGEIVADGTPTELRHQVGEAFVTVHDSEPPSVEFGAPWRPLGSQWAAALNEAQRVQAATALAKMGTPFTVAPPTLADVFASLTGAALHEVHSDSYTPDQES